VIAAAIFIEVGCATKFAKPDHECLVEQAAQVEIFDEGGEGLVLDGHEERLDRFAVLGVSVPAAAVGLVFDACPVDLNQANAGLDQPAGEEARLGETAGAVAFAQGGRLTLQIKSLAGVRRVQKFVGFLGVLAEGAGSG